MLPGYMMGNTHRIRGASETEGETRRVTRGAQAGKALKQKVCAMEGGSQPACGPGWGWVSIALSLRERRGGAGSDVGRWGERSGGWWRPRTQDLAIVQRGDASSLQFPCSLSL